MTEEKIYKIIVKKKTIWTEKQKKHKSRPTHTTHWSMVESVVSKKIFTEESREKII